MVSRSKKYEIRYIDLPNLENIFLSNKNNKSIILYADFNVSYYLYKEKIKLPREIIVYPDSTLIYLILRVKGFKVRKYVSTNLLNNLLLKSIEAGRKLFFFGDLDETLAKIKFKLKNSFNNIELSGFHQGYDFDNEDLIKRINNANCDILFVGLGATRQEFWIIDNYKKIQCSLIISVGGWFKLLSGELNRAPTIFRKNGLEWLYKLITEFPRLWKRYLIIGPIFIFHVFVSKRIKILSEHA